MSGCSTASFQRDCRSFPNFSMDPSSKSPRPDPGAGPILPDKGNTKFQCELRCQVSSVKYVIYQCVQMSLQLYTEYVGFYSVLHIDSAGPVLRMESLPAGITTALVLSS